LAYLVGDKQSQTRPGYRPDQGQSRHDAVRIAETLGIEKQSVYDWKRVPPLRVLTVSEIIGMPPEEIRPDVFKK